jgi:hypothetical protein
MGGVSQSHPGSWLTPVQPPRVGRSPAVSMSVNGRASCLELMDRTWVNSADRPDPVSPPRTVVYQREQQLLSRKPRAPHRGFCLSCIMGISTRAEALYNPRTVACRSIRLPARCFTRTASLGWHHFTSVSREDLNEAQRVLRRSTSAKNSLRASPPRNAAPA